MNALLEKPETAVPTAQETEMAAEGSRFLAAKKPDSSLSVMTDNGQKFVLPKSAERLLGHLLTEMAYGNAVTIIPIHAELTTQEAADFLNVSRPSLVRLLEDRKIPFHKVGSHRRVRFSDLTAYRKQFETEREQLMNELASQAQELEMGY